MVEDESYRIPWCFPCYFFMFLAFFISVKFVFIFFFETSFEPEFIFDLTPFYLLSGLDQLQLLFISLVFLIVDAYLHYHSTRKNLIYSFVFTITLLLGTGIAITSRSLIFNNIFYYIIFLCLILVILIDHRHILDYPDYLDEIYKDRSGLPSRSKRPVFQFFPKEFPTLNLENIAFSKPSSKTDVSRGELRKASELLVKLENKKQKLGDLEEEIERRRKILVGDEQHLHNDLSDLTGLDSLSPSFFKTKEVIDEFSKDLKEKDSVDFFDDIEESAFIVRKGKIKKVNQKFLDILGYDVVDIVDKNFLSFIVPKDYSKLQRYYLKRLNGKSVSSYEVGFKTKDNDKVFLNVELKSTIFNGKKAQIAVVKKINDKKE